MTRAHLLWKAVLLSCCLASPVAAQSLTSGGLSLMVADSAGEPVNDARVVLTAAATGIEHVMTTPRSGRVGLSLLPVGDYELLVERVGYRPVRALGVPIRPGRRLELDVSLTPARPPVVTVDTLRAPTVSLGLSRAGVSQWFSELELFGLPGGERELSDVARLSTVADEALETEGLPAYMSGLLVDGQAVGLARPPVLTSDVLRSPAFPSSAFRAAELLVNDVDVELASPGGGLLSGYTLQGSRDLRVRAFGAWARGAPGLSGTGGVDPYQNLHSGFILSGPIIRDTASFVLGVEASQSEAPPNAAWASDSLIARVASIAQDSYNVTLDDSRRSGIVQARRVSAFGRLDWQLAPSHLLRVRANFASVPTGLRDDRFVSGSGIGGTYTGAEFSSGVLLTSRLGRRLAQEVQVGFDLSRRDYDSGLLRLPAREGSGASFRTLLAGTGGGLGIGPAGFSELDQSAVRVSETLYVEGAAHRLKLGVSADFLSYDQSRAGAAPGEFLFSGLEGFASGVGSFRGAVGPPSPASFSVPRLAAYLQDTWSVAPGLELLVGARYDVERLPRDEVAVNPAWFARTGLHNAEFPVVSQQLNPRASFVWDVQEQHRWILRGAAGLYSGFVDPTLLGEALTLDGTREVRRGSGLLATWPAAPAEDGSVSGSALTLLAPGFGSPRTSRAALGLSRLLGDHTALHLSATYRRTDRLPRRADLNLVPAAATRDQYGRPLLGDLQARAGLLLAAAGSNRRFADFDQVSAINADGWSTYRSLTVALERRLAGDLDLFASYTFSQTRDNVPSLREGTSDAQLDPFPAAADDDDWREGVSDLDVPHRAAVGAQWQDLLVRGLRLGAVYRFRSGYPFTPGFRGGVDANGDGSASNDPAFVDARLAGMDALIGSWPCLAESAGGFVERNACRTDAIHSLDLRLGIRVLASPRYSAELVVDGLNLLGAEPAYADRALYLVDPAGTVSVDPATGTRTVPLLANPGFGQPLVGLTTGRALRVGLRVNY